METVCPGAVSHRRFFPHFIFGELNAESITSRSNAKTIHDHDFGELVSLGIFYGKRNILWCEQVE